MPQIKAKGSFQGAKGRTGNVQSWGVGLIASVTREHSSESVVAWGDCHQKTASWRDASPAAISKATVLHKYWPVLMAKGRVRAKWIVPSPVLIKHQPGSFIRNCLPSPGSLSGSSSRCICCHHVVSSASHHPHLRWKKGTSGAASDFEFSFKSCPSI